MKDTRKDFHMKWLAAALLLGALVAQAQADCGGSPVGPTNSVWIGCDGTATGSNCTGTCGPGGSTLVRSMLSSSTVVLLHAQNCMWALVYFMLLLFHQRKPTHAAIRVRCRNSPVCFLQHCCRSAVHNCCPFGCPTACRLLPQS